MTIPPPKSTSVPVDQGRVITTPSDFGMAFRPAIEADRAARHILVASLVLWSGCLLVGVASMRAAARLGWTLGLGAVLLFALWDWRQRLGHFCEEWLLADLPLRPSARTVWSRRGRTWPETVAGARELLGLVTGKISVLAAETAHQTESLGLFTVVWLCLALIPQFTPSDLACVLLMLVCALAWAAFLQPATFSRLRRMLTLTYVLRRAYFTYPDRTERQQGLWTPPQSLVARQASYCVMLGALFGVVAFALSGRTAVLPQLAVTLCLPLVAEVVLFTVLLTEWSYLDALADAVAKHGSDSRCPWQQLIDRKLGSYRPDERDRVLWALDAKSKEPILVDRSVLAEHVHVRGATGSGKTSGALIPVALQLLDAVPAGDKPDPMIVLDLGGDQAMFHAIRLATERKGRRFRLFSVQSGHASDYLNPLECLLSDEMRDPQLASMFVEAFNLDYGLRYGAQYFTEQNLHSFLTALRFYRQHTDRKPSLRSFYEFLRDNQQRSEFRNSEQIMMCVGFLLDYPQLNRPDFDSGAVDQISFRRVLDESEVVYFFLPTLNESVFVREIAGLALYGLLAAAMQRTNSGQNARDPRRTWVVIDEFHELVGASFANLLAQSRKFGLGLVLANQSTAQLDNRDVNLAALVEENTAVRQYFTVTSDDIIPLQRLSGDEEKIKTRVTQSVKGTSTSQEWVREPALELNEILETSGKRQDCFLIVRDGEGAATPRHAVTLYPMTLAEYRRLRHLPLPRRQEARPESKVEPSPRSDQRSPATANDDWRIERQRRLEALWERYLADQRLDPPQRRGKK